MDRDEKLTQKDYSKANAFIYVFYFGNKKMQCLYNCSPCISLRFLSLVRLTYLSYVIIVYNVQICLNSIKWVKSPNIINLFNNL